MSVFKPDGKSFARPLRSDVTEVISGSAMSFDVENGGIVFLPWDESLGQFAGVYLGTTITSEIIENSQQAPLVETFPLGFASVLLSEAVVAGDSLGLADGGTFIVAAAPEDQRAIAAEAGASGSVIQAYIDYNFGGA